MKNFVKKLAVLGFVFSIGTELFAPNLCIRCQVTVDANVYAKSHSECNKCFLCSKKLATVGFFPEMLVSREAYQAKLCNECYEVGIELRCSECKKKFKEGEEKEDGIFH